MNICFHVAQSTTVITFEWSNVKVNHSNIKWVIFSLTALLNFNYLISWDIVYSYVRLSPHSYSSPPIICNTKPFLLCHKKRFQRLHSAWSCVGPHYDWTPQNFFICLIILPFFSVHYLIVSPLNCGPVTVGLPCAPCSGDPPPAILIIHT